MIAMSDSSLSHAPDEATLTADNVPFLVHYNQTKGSV
jgi:hypothetical protein